MVSLKTPNRDTVTSINKDGSRFFIHPADVRGKYTSRRRLVAWLLIAVFVALPWIPINGFPAVFLDIAERRFHLFGLTLAFQDTWLLFFFVSGLAFSLYYVTALWGRVWCGWVCPQTVYLEHVFRRLERLIDGDAPARRALDAAPWTTEKVLKRVLKHSLFLVCSALIAHIFLSYFVSLPRLWGMMTSNPREHWSAFLFVGGFSAILYVNFSWFREQLCIVICPYGRLQSSLLDDHSKNVAYDYRRGNPPGKPKDPHAGDCIDCRRCVQVCPTGIDIRQGLQLECVACTACMDACDEIMVKLGRAPGLIRYASDQNLEGRPTRWFRPRMIVYTLLLFLGAGVALYSFGSVRSFSAQVTRMSGSPFYVTDTTVRNQFQVRLVNKSNDPQEFHLLAPGATGSVTVSGFEQAVSLASMQEENITFTVEVPRDSYTGGFSLDLVVEAAPGGHRLEETVEFLGPDPELLRAQP